jgi:stage IV sporulation protein FB
VAAWLGYRVFALKVALFHGLCEHTAAKYEWDDIKIAWGGVSAQMLVAILVFSLNGLGGGQFAYFGPILVFVGYYSLLTIPYNLMPIRGLDGYKAWRIIPLGYQQMKQRAATKRALDRERKGR